MLNHQLGAHNVTVINFFRNLSQIRENKTKKPEKTKDKTSTADLNQISFFSVISQKVELRNATKRFEFTGLLLSCRVVL